jgi:adenylyltransferase/sulfurtransferase
MVSLLVHRQDSGRSRTNPAILYSHLTVPKNSNTEDFSPAELRRYQRHLTLPQVGLEGQRELKSASVLLVGAGGLGSPAALYLAAAGVGRIGIVDFDSVDESNLHRQILHGTSDVGRPKTASAADRLAEVNPYVRLDLHETLLTSDNALDIVSQYDIVADGTDNFPTRYLVNDACVLSGKPNVYASIYQFEGQISVFATGGGPCYRCLYPLPPPPGLVPSCAEGGVLGILPGLVGTLQATEVIKHVLGIGEPLVGRLLVVDALESSFRTMTIGRDPLCPVCGDNPTIHTLIDYDEFCGLGARGDGAERTVSGSGPTSAREMSVAELKKLVDSGRRPFLLDVRKPFENEIATLAADQLIPVEELVDRIAEIRAKADERIVVHCRSGVRSARAVQILTAAGYTDAVNLSGGILAWSDEIDAGVMKY